MRISKTITIILVFICILILLPMNVFGAVVKPVFYSLSPYGAGSSYDIKTGSPTISITSGVATLSVAQTGNIGVGCDIDYGAGPTNVYIAPNRIPFNSGGTTELKVGDKIEGGTSSATGIVRAIEITSGSWAGGDAAGYIYLSTSSGTWQSEQINRTKPSTSSDIASCTGAIQGNIGNGNTQFVVKDPDGDDAANDSGNVNYIYHEYTSLSGYEAGFTDANHINNASLVAATVVAHTCCYYDHDDQTLDTNIVTFSWSGTTNATYYLQVFVPIGQNESINNQKHNGIRTTSKYFLYIDNPGNVVVIQEGYVKFDGLQIEKTLDSGTIVVAVSNTYPGGSCYFNDNIILYSGGSGSHIGLRATTGSTTSYIYAWNNIIYDCATGVNVPHANTTGYCYNNTIEHCGTGIIGTSSNTIAKNNIINNCTYVFTTVTNSLCGYNVEDESSEEGAFGSTHSTGTTDGSGSQKLIDSGATFIADGVQINSIVKNTTDTTYACVTAVDSETQLSLNDNIFVSGEDYIIYTNMYGAATFNNEGGDDFHLDSSDTAAKDKGIDLSTDANLPLWDDIEADARGATWDVGADEYIAPAGGLSIPIVMYHYMHH